MRWSLPRSGQMDLDESIPSMRRHPLGRAYGGHLDCLVRFHAHRRQYFATFFCEIGPSWSCYIVSLTKAPEVPVRTSPFLPAVRALRSIPWRGRSVPCGPIYNSAFMPWTSLRKSSTLPQEESIRSILRALWRTRCAENHFGKRRC